MIEAKNLCFAYSRHGKIVLNDLSFSVSNGEIVALLGVNGAGKSTAISLLAGLARPRSGEIFIDGVSLKSMRLTEKAKRIGYVPQKLELPPLSVFDTLVLGRMPNYWLASTSVDQDKAWQMLEDLGLTELADKRSDQISGGERQLLAIGTALINEPSVLLLDEPTSNLDPKHRLEVLSLIRNAAKKRDCAVLLSLHDLNEAYRFADRLLFMKGGALHSDVKKEDLASSLIYEVFGVPSSIHEGPEGKYIVIQEQKGD